MNYRRCESLDVLKTISAFLIVCIHAPFPGIVGEYLIAIARIGVPIFFMITGYFYDCITERGREKQQIKKIFILLVVSNLLYFVKDLIASCVNGNLCTYINEQLSINRILHFLLLNESPFAGHL